MRTALKVKKHAVWLDPTLETGSSIRYAFKIEAHKSKRHDGREHESKSFDSTVYLTDCDDSISWSGYGDSGFKHLRTKLTNAIRALERAVRDIDELETAYGDLPGDDS